MQYTAAQFTRVDDALTAEASELGLPPGQWPVKVEVDGVVYSNGAPFWNHEGELESLAYSAGEGREVIIYND